MGIEQRVADEIAHFFMFNFDIELEDSPQILDRYLYLEFWFNGRQIKIRMPYSISKDFFLRQGTFAREHILMKEVISGVKKQIKGHKRRVVRYPSYVLKSGAENAQGVLVRTVVAIKQGLSGDLDGAHTPDSLKRELLTGNGK